MNLQTELERARATAPVTTLGVDSIYRRRARRDRVRRAATISVASVIGLAGVAGVVTAFDPPDRRVATTTAVVDLSLPTGSYYYERIDRYNLIPYRGAPDVETASDELWLAPDGSGRFVFDGKIINYAPITGDDAHQDVSFAAGGSPWEWVDLPIDAEGMREALQDRGAPDGASPAPSTPSPGMEPDDWRIVRAAEDLLERHAHYLAPPQRRALFEVLRGLSFFEVTTGAIDPLGRPATELAVIYDGARILWFFDEESGQWLARVVQKPRTGDVLLAEVMIQQGVVGDTTSTQLEMSFVTPPVFEQPDFLAGAGL